VGRRVPAPACVVTLVDRLIHRGEVIASRPTATASRNQGTHSRANEKTANKKPTLLLLFTGELHRFQARFSPESLPTGSHGRRQEASVDALRARRSGPKSVAGTSLLVLGIRGRVVRNRQEPRDVRSASAGRRFRPYDRHWLSKKLIHAANAAPEITPCAANARKWIEPKSLGRTDHDPRIRWRPTRTGEHRPTTVPAERYDR
jgi:hypothetical protein